MPGPYDIETGVLAERLFDFLTEQGTEPDRAVKACIKLAVVMVVESGAEVDILHDLVDFYIEATEATEAPEPKDKSS